MEAPLPLDIRAPFFFRALCVGAKQMMMDAQPNTVARLISSAAITKRNDVMYLFAQVREGHALIQTIFANRIAN